VLGWQRQRDLDEIVTQSLQGAALWEEVKDNLKQDALSLSLGQQQRLCIARVIAVEPEIILMDEPASALDPIATLKIEDLMRELVRNYTIVIVTPICSRPLACQIGRRSFLLRMAKWAGWWNTAPRTACSLTRATSVPRIT
jgi:ABC-type phosphate transport system ATPase subunit